VSFRAETAINIIWFGLVKRITAFTATHCILQVINTTYSDVHGLASATIYGLDGAVLHHQEHPPTTFPATSTSVSFRLPKETDFGASSVYFVLLKLKTDVGSRLLSRNFYWLSKDDGNFTALQGAWRNRHVPSKVRVCGRYVPFEGGAVQGGTYELTVEVSNASGGIDAEGVCPDLSVDDSDGGPARPGEIPVVAVEDEHSGLRGGLGGSAESEVADRSRRVEHEELCPQTDSGDMPGVAFWLHLGVLKGVDEESGGNLGAKYRDSRILPVHYSDNYFSLTPGETKRVVVGFASFEEAGQPSLLLDGWNVKRLRLRLKKQSG
jgi:mannosylglycoprotein endo-beta-mannosidase